MSENHLNEPSPSKKHPIINTAIPIVAIALCVLLLFSIINSAIAIISTQKFVAELSTDSYWLGQYYLSKIQPLKPYLCFVVVQLVLVTIIIFCLFINKKKSNSTKLLPLIILATLNVAIPIITPMTKALRHNLNFTTFYKVLHVINCIISILLLILIIYKQKKKKQLQSNTTASPHPIPADATVKETADEIICDDKTKQNKPARFFRNLLQDPKMLYVISAMLFTVSLIIFAVTNIRFICVELLCVLIVIVTAVGLNSWKFFSFESFSAVLLIAVGIGFVLTISILIIEGPNVNIEWQEEWHHCYACNGTGKVINDFGWKVKCSRCNGVGKLYY